MPKQVKEEVTASRGEGSKHLEHINQSIRDDVSRFGIKAILFSDSERLYKMLVVIPFGVLFALTALPLLATFVTSLFGWYLGDPMGPKFIGFSNYSQMFSDPTFWNSIGKTAYQVIVTVSGQMVLGMSIALLLSRKFRGVGLLRSLYIIPMMITPVIVGLLWRMLFNPSGGAINYFLSLVGIHGPNWLGDTRTAMPAIILTDLWFSTPFVGVILLAGILSIPTEIFEAARVDGASASKIFWNITLPLLRPMIFLSLLFRLMDAMKRFDSIYVMTGGGPGNSTETLDLHIYFATFENLQVGYSAAMGCVLLVLIFGVSIVILRKMENE
jgi:multiple sugar transport system permease protein